MSNSIVKVCFGWGDSYAIYRGYDGKILSWAEIDDLIDQDKLSTLPPDIAKQISHHADGTALFDTEQEAEQVLSIFL